MGINHEHTALFSHKKHGSCLSPQLDYKVFLGGDHSLYIFCILPGLASLDWLIFDQQIKWEILSVYAFMYFVLSGERIQNFHQLLKEVHDPQKVKSHYRKR